VPFAAIVVADARQGPGSIAREDGDGRRTRVLRVRECNSVTSFLLIPLLMFIRSRTAASFKRTRRKTGLYRTIVCAPEMDRFAGPDHGPRAGLNAS